MFIPLFAPFVDKYTSKDQPLNGSTLVIDGQNYFYGLYQKSGLQFIFGCESDKYLEYLKEHLSMYKIANVKCHFLFKCGHESVDKRAKKGTECDGKFQVGQGYKKIVPPIFMWEIHRQVLEEMGFNYAICENENRTECLALAQKLQCPIVSYNIKFILSNVPYISFYTIKFNEHTQVITGNIFESNHFLEQLRIDEDKLVIFTLLMDQDIFPANYFVKPLSFLKLTPGNSRAFEKIFNWLAGISTDQAMKFIFSRINKEDKAKFLEAQNELKNMRREETTGIPSEYLENRCSFKITEKDPMWFEKGVTSQKIAFSYLNLYRTSNIFGSHSITNHEAEEPLLLSSEIIKYAFNLLTNFQREKFVIKPPQKEDIRVETTGISKPEYEAEDSVFENGWDNILSLGLFEHFLKQTIPGFEDLSLDEVPDDAKLLMIAFWYFKRYSTDENTDAIVGSVMLSYVSLGVIEEPRSNDTNNNMAAITDMDKKQVKQLLSEYRSPIKYSAASQIFKPTLIHPFVKFQHCLEHLGFLNKLCGSPYNPTVFSKTINGTFIYRVLYTMVRESAGDPFGFLTEMLSSAPTVLAFVEGLLQIYREA